MLYITQPHQKTTDIVAIDVVWIFDEKMLKYQRQISPPVAIKRKATVIQLIRSTFEGDLVEWHRSWREQQRPDDFADRVDCHLVRLL